MQQMQWVIILTCVREVLDYQKFFFHGPGGVFLFGSVKLFDLGSAMTSVDPIRT